jgi:predicted aconitase with swiveling domain
MSIIEGKGVTQTVVLTGRTISAGQVEGEALVTRMPVAWFNTAMEDATGIIRKDGHELEGQSVKGKIFVFDTDIGSTGGSLGIYNKVKMGTGPLGIIYREAHGISASGAIFAGLPAMDRIREGIPWQLIKTGDWVKLDATNGRIEVTRGSKR